MTHFGLFFIKETMKLTLLDNVVCYACAYFIWQHVMLLYKVPTVNAWLVGITGAYLFWFLYNVYCGWRARGNGQ